MKICIGILGRIQKEKEKEKVVYMIYNPILPGFYPDTSICRVEDDFYLVTSSFSFFPGIPVFHSRDLMHWEQIGHVLDRQTQLHVTYEDISMGIFAPTIRYYDGIYYVISTNMTTHENFICTASDPAGSWSDPHVLKSVEGIDPSLFFDEDGKVYFTGTGGGFGSKRYDHQVIICSEIDLVNFQLVGEEWAIGDGAAKDAKSPEGPHIYKKDGWYYLMVAEGGTEHFHAVTISRSKNISGPYENYDGNPILTHRHLGKNYPVCNVGHADMVELKDSSWYMVCLASRLVGGYHKPLGRETFLTPVTWEDGWPVVSYGTGKVEMEYPSPNLGECIFTNGRETDNFEDDKLSMEWNYLGTPYTEFVKVQNQKLHIKMLAKNMVPEEFEGKKFDFFDHIPKIGKTKESMPFIGKRIQSFSFLAETLVEMKPSGSESAGIAILQNNANQIRLEGMENDTKTITFSVKKVQYGLCDGRMHYDVREEGNITIPRTLTYGLKVKATENQYSFAIVEEGKEYEVARNVDGGFLGSESAGGFVGAYIGLFATGNGTSSENEAIFHYFSIRTE